MNESFYIYIWKLVLGFVHLLGLSENYISKSQYQKNVLCRHFLLWDRTCWGSIAYRRDSLLLIRFNWNWYILFFGTWNICLVLDHRIYTIWQKFKTFNFSHRMHMLSMPADVLYSKWNALVFIKWKCTNLLFIKFANDSTVVCYDLSDCGKVEYCQNLSRIWV